MRIQQFEVCQLVGEAWLAEPGDVGVASMVLGMAATAFTGAGARHTAVVAALAADVFRNIFVTIQTERGLSLTTRSVVAVGAIAFDFGVRRETGPGMMSFSRLAAPAPGPKHSAIGTKTSALAYLSNASTFLARRQWVSISKCAPR